MNKKEGVTYVAIVDDKKAIRQALEARLAEGEKYHVLFTAENGEDFLEKMMTARKNITPDVVLMDIDMPVMTGIQAVERAREVYPLTKFLMLTIFDEDQKIFEAIKAGANGYLLKDEPVEKIKEAIRNLLDEHGAPMSPAIARKALELLMNAKEMFKAERTSDEEYDLTDREKEILKHLVNGYEYKEIAAFTGVSPNTIRNHIANIYKKLHVTSKAQAIRKVINKKWMG